LSDAVCNASGLGYKEDTNSWDLCSNVEAVEFELGLNLKESLDKWNKGTMRWLRYVVYERFGPNVKTLATYAASAMWHGFYPGYYITFLSGALFTSSARIVRDYYFFFYFFNHVLLTHFSRYVKRFDQCL
jgi:lysophospholipid acyltransferase 1/2